MHSNTYATVKLSVQRLASRIRNSGRLQRSPFTFCVLKLHIVGLLTVNQRNYFCHHRSDSGLAKRGCYF